MYSARWRKFRLGPVMFTRWAAAVRDVTIFINLLLQVSIFFPRDFDWLQCWEYATEIPCETWENKDTRVFWSRCYLTFPYFTQVPWSSGTSKPTASYFKYLTLTSLLNGFPKLNSLHLSDPEVCGCVGWEEFMALVQPSVMADESPTFSENRDTYYIPSFLDGHY